MTPASHAASAEPVAGYLVRVHAAGGGFGSDYEAVCVVEADWGRLWWRWLLRKPVAVVKGFCVRGRPPMAATASVVRAVENRLRALGFARMRYERRRGQGRVPFEKTL